MNIHIQYYRTLDDKTRKCGANEWQPICCNNDTMRTTSINITLK
jgi:hypothetical protein